MTPHTAHREAGNILFYILIAVALLGFLMAAMQRTGSIFQDVDSEQMLIKVNQAQRYGPELERAVRYILSNNASETDIRFAHPSAHSSYGAIGTTPPFQVFAAAGGNAEYRNPPAGVSTSARWEFTGNTRIPQVGSDRADLVAVLPDVSLAFCNRVNKSLGLTTMPVDPAGCVYNSGLRFAGTYEAVPNTIPNATFTRLPPLQACIQCTDTGLYYYYYVILPR